MRALATYATKLYNTSTPLSIAKLQQNSTFEEKNVAHVPQVSAKALPVQAVVAAKTQLARQMWEVALELSQPVAFAAGQFAMVEVATGVARAYSLASQPGDLPKIVLCVGTAPGGIGSKFFDSLKAGDTANLSMPYGNFVVKADARPLLFVATGSGIAPFRAMVPQILADGYSEKVHLMFGVRSEADLFYQSYFEELAARYANFTFTPTLSQPSDAWQGSRGRVTAHLENFDGDVYICGSKEMIMDVRRLLVAKGVPALSMKFEIFN